MDVLGDEGEPVMTLTTSMIMGRRDAPQAAAS
jgi:hypothetical protein